MQSTVRRSWGWARREEATHRSARLTATAASEGAALRVVCVAAAGALTLGLTATDASSEGNFSRRCVFAAGALTVGGDSVVLQMHG